jgi:lipopolysaccharide/colanic/teichoic acid biosynthesis glycosyltransferase
MCDGRIQNTNCENVVKQSFHCSSKVQIRLPLWSSYLVGLSYFMPLIEAVNALIKFAQGGNVFICDFVVVIKICQIKFYMVYFNP